MQVWQQQLYKFYTLGYLIFFNLLFRQLSLYCLVDEVLRHGEIMPDEKKKLTFHYFLFFPPTCPKIKGFFSKTASIPIEFVYFYYKKSLSNFFFIFPSDQSQYTNFNFYFFSSDEAQNTFVGARRPNNIVRAALSKQCSPCVSL